MNSSVPLSPRTLAPRRQIGLLTALTGAVLVALFVLPNALARSYVNVGNVGEVVRRGFVVYWRSGSQNPPGELEDAITFWFRFHLVKAGVAALLLAVVVALGVVLWRRSRQRADGRTGSRLALGLSQTPVALIGLFALVVLLANLQGAAAPFASLFPMLTSGGGGTELGTTLTQVQDQLVAYPGGAHAPALTRMVDDLTTYHVVFAALTGVLALALAGTSVVVWRRLRTASDARSRRTIKVTGTASALLAALVLVVVLANISTATHSPEALAALFAGGW